MMRGFTLIEVLVLIVVSVVALLALVNLFLIFNSIYGYQQAFIATAGSAGKAMNALEASVLPADAVLASRTVGGTLYTSATTTLVLELPSVDGSGNLVTGAKDYIVFYTASTTLYRLVSANAQSARISGTTILSTTLSALSFTYDNTDFTKVTKVTTDIQTQKQFKTQILSSHLRGQWYLRNIPSL